MSVNKLIKDLEEYNVGEAMELVLNRKIDFDNLYYDEFNDLLREAFKITFADYRAIKVRREQNSLRKSYLSRIKNCEVCGKDNVKLEFHHKIPVCAGGSNKPSNIQIVCKDCHKKSYYDLKNEWGE